MVTMTNKKMYQALEALEPLLDKSGRFGFAVAKNRRKLINELTEYIKARQTAMDKLAVMDEDGNRLVNVADLEAEMAGINELTAEMELCMVDEESVIEQNLTAREIQTVLWMIKEEQ